MSNPPPNTPPVPSRIPAHVAQHLPPHLRQAHGRYAPGHAQALAQVQAAMAAADPDADPLGVADPTIAHPGADQCAVCTKPRGRRDREWNSSGTWWCEGCKDAYAAFRQDNPIPAGSAGLASQMPTYMYAPAYWPGLGFAASDLDPYRPNGNPTHTANTEQGES